MPNAVVAEVLHDQPMQQPPASAPGWQVGQVEWRDEQAVPVISFEGICGDRIPKIDYRSNNVVLMHSIVPDCKTRYYGLYIESVPTFEFVDNTSLTIAPDQMNNADYVANRVFINGIDGFIPELDEISRLLG